MSDPQDKPIPDEPEQSQPESEPADEADETALPDPTETEPDAQQPNALEAKEEAAGPRGRLIGLLVLLVVLAVASFWYNRHVKAQQLMTARDLLNEGQNQQLSPDERWTAIQEGIVMLRDQLIQEYPERVALYAELARVYLGQMANQQDQLRMFYVFRHAVQLVLAGGGPRPIDWASYKGAPTTTAALATSLGEAKYAELQKIVDPESTAFDMLEVEFRQSGQLTEQVVEPLREAGLLQPFDQFLRARWLIEGLKLEPAYILKLEETLGPLDFRLPEAHAIYWAQRGLDLQPEDPEELEQMVFQALQQSFLEGRLVYLSPDGMPMLGPNTAIVDEVRARFEARLMANQSHVVKASYERFLQDAVITLFMEGEQEKAAEYLDLLTAQLPLEDQETMPELKVYVVDTLGIPQARMDDAQRQNAVGSLLMRVYMQLALNREPQAQTLVWMASCLQDAGSDEFTPPEVDEVKVKDIGTEDLRWRVLAAATLNVPPPLAQNLVQKLDVDREKLEQVRQELIEQAEAARQQQGAAPPGSLPGGPPPAVSPGEPALPPVVPGAE